MRTDYTTLKKELTKAIKDAGYNTRQIKLIKGEGVGSYYDEMTYKECEYGEDVIAEINEKGITIDQVNKIIATTLKKYEARATIKASDALKAQFEDLAQEVNEKIKEVKIAEVVYVDNEKNVGIYAHRYSANDVRIYTIATDLKSKYLSINNKKRQNDNITAILAEIEIKEPSVVDFSEIYKYDSDTDQEVKLKIDIDYYNKKLTEEKDYKISREAWIKGLKNAKCAIRTSSASYTEALAFHESATLFKTQRSEFSKIKYYKFYNYDVYEEKLDECDEIETSYRKKNSSSTHEMKIEEALRQIDKNIINIEEVLENCCASIAKLEKSLKDAEADLQKLLNK